MHYVLRPFFFEGTRLPISAIESCELARVPPLRGESSSDCVNNVLRERPVLRACFRPPCPADTACCVPRFESLVINAYRSWNTGASAGTALDAHGTDHGHTFATDDSECQIINMS